MLHYQRSLYFYGCGGLDATAFVVFAVFIIVLPFGCFLSYSL
ncbi:hypothetical protein [Bartonella raoultii]|nr:hypothetical protein [Bartonella raoultii]